MASTQAWHCLWRAYSISDTTPLPFLIVDLYHANLHVMEKEILELQWLRLDFDRCTYHDDGLNELEIVQDVFDQYLSKFDTDHHCPLKLHYSKSLEPLEDQPYELILQVQAIVPWRGPYDEQGKIWHDILGVLWKCYRWNIDKDHSTSRCILREGRDERLHVLLPEYGMVNLMTGSCQGHTAVWLSTHQHVVLKEISAKLYNDFELMCLHGLLKDLRYDFYKEGREKWYQLHQLHNKTASSLMTMLNEAEVTISTNFKPSCRQSSLKIVLKETEAKGRSKSM